MSQSFWKGKKVFITGHTGFKGGWLSLWLQQMQADVTGFSLEPPTTPNLFDVAQVASGMKSITGDIRDADALRTAMLRAAPDIVIHMAAQALVRRSYRDPVETYSTNVMGTVNVLEAVRQQPSVKAVVNITSDKCYENKEWLWGYRENDPMGGHDPYSSSKGCAELVASAYRNSYFSPQDPKGTGIALASARAGNVIGGGDWSEDRLLPDILDAFAAGRPVTIRSPNAIRPWQHVLEPLSGYLMLAQRLYEDGAAYAEGWNFGPNEDDARPVKWIADQLVRHWGNGASWRLDDGVHPHEATYLRLDCTKAKTRLNWRPQLQLSEALAQTVSWYQAYLRGDDMRDFSLKQIEKFGGAKS